MQLRYKKKDVLFDDEIPKPLVLIGRHGSPYALVNSPVFEHMRWKKERAFKKTFLKHGKKLVMILEMV